MPALVTVFAYAGSFTVYTYIISTLVKETRLSQSNITLYIFLFGIFSAIGNLFVGKLTDRLGIDKANVVIIAGIALTALSTTFFAGSAVAMAVLVSLLGFFSFASVPALQNRLIATATKLTKNGHNVASGLNIAGFNLAIAGGSIIGGLTIKHIGLIYTGLVGAALSGIGLLMLLYQIRKKRI
ncbi:MAG: MFS transporter [Bacteroidetes bacterium]|nr:MFS transporter [Bacteroidota bacterium]